MTTDCNRSCPWCSTASRPGKSTYLGLETFRSLLPAEGRFEVQLEGGEALLHPGLGDLVGAARATGRCDCVVLSTNGVLVPGERPRLDAWLDGLGRPLLLKVSVNHHLVERDPLHVEKVARLAAAARERGVELVVNVRLRRDRAVADDAPVVESVRRAGLLPKANVFFLQRYGLARDDERLAPPHLVGQDFTLANPDGRTFGQDLVGRSEAMDALP